MARPYFIGSPIRAIALAVAEPRGALARALARVVALDVGDAVDRLQAREVVLLEHHAAAPQLGDGGLDVVDLPAHLRVLARRGAGRLEQRELAAAAAVEQAAGPLLDRLEPELLGVEARARSRSCAGSLVAVRPLESIPARASQIAG